MKQRMYLWHGAPTIIERPEYGFGKSYNDFGLGFYCTEHKDSAREWACNKKNSGFINQYHLDTKTLSVLNLCSEEFSILHWVALLSNNREFSPVSMDGSTAVAYLQQHFLPNIATFDVIIGFRADDSCFSIVRAFLDSKISLKQLKELVAKENPALQVVLTSREAFKHLGFVNCEAVENTIYYTKRKSRDLQLHTAFIDALNAPHDNTALYMSQIVEERMGEHDERLR